MPLIIDCDGIANVEEFWDRYESSVGAESARFFGRNLNAIWDALEGGGPGCPDATHVIFKNAAKLRDLKTHSGDNFLAILREIATNVSSIRVEVL
ncbi:barstar family protein [Rhizobium rhizogenes]|uniref:barstar family protein n=1 Tax=Rhizobium rhizogenes TaxID=359 RepID=UPI00080FAC9E|nr:barstar family protein [Rhizobium rhizogenes]OCJ25559.1 hypothetical protein A6U88_03665 [Agrobacterium sp. B131/95]